MLEKSYRIFIEETHVHDIRTMRKAPVVINEVERGVKVFVLLRAGERGQLYSTVRHPKSKDLRHSQIETKKNEDS